MSLTPRQYALIACAAILLSVISAYLAREYKTELHAEKASKETLQKDYDLAKAGWTVKEAQLTRRIKSSQGTRPAVVNGEVVHNKDGSVAFEQYQVISDEYENVVKQLEVMTEVIKNKETNITELSERIDQLESSKPGVKKFGAMGIYSFPGWQVGAGFHQDFGIIDAGIYGLIGIDHYSHSLALNIRL